MFLQYNRIIFGAVAAYTTPGAINPQNIIVDASTDVTVSSESRIIIPKINVDAPVVYGAASDTKSQSEAMRRGVAHFFLPHTPVMMPLPQETISLCLPRMKN